MFERFRRWIDDPAAFGRTPPPPGANLPSVLGQVMCLAGLAEEFIDKLPDQRDTCVETPSSQVDSL
jgi:hypothetical protein